MAGDELKKGTDADTPCWTPGFKITKKNHCDVYIFEHSFRLRSLKPCSNISLSQ